MVYSVEIPLQFSKGIIVRPDMGSLMQGALMEIIDDEVAGRLHHIHNQPYTQCIYYQPERNQAYWRLTALNSQGYEYIIKPILQYDKPLYLKQRNCLITLGVPQHIQQQSYQALTDSIFQGVHAPKGVDITFLTAVSFKRNGIYDSWPDISRWYRNILRKWNTFADGISLEQSGLDGELASQCSITKFHLDSRMFGLEGIQIPGLIGSMRLYFHGNTMIRNLQGLLWLYTPFCGLGIKNAMGMGAVNTNIRY